MNSLKGLDNVFLEIDDVNLEQKNSANEDIKKYRLFTRVTRDIFHQFHTLSLPKGSVATMIIFHLVQLATWVYNNKDYNKVIEVLAMLGVEDIRTHQYYNKPW